MDQPTDVTQASSPEPQQPSVNTQGVATLPAESIGVPTSLTVPASVNAAEEVDERGVSYKNVAAEYRRKYEDVSKKVDSMSDMLSSFVSSQTKQEQKYTIADLEAYKANNPNLSPNDLAIIETEKARLLREEIAESVRNEYKQINEAQRNEQIKQQSLNAVTQQYPDLITRDVHGNATWNANNPMVQRMGQYMSDPLIANRPDGVLLASRLAYADLAQAGLIKAQTQVAAKQAEVGNLNRMMAVESGAINNVSQPNSYMQNLNTLKQTGSSDAARSVLKSIIFGQQ